MHSSFFACAVSPFPVRQSVGLSDVSVFWSVVRTIICVALYVLSLIGCVFIILPAVNCTLVSCASTVLSSAAIAATVLLAAAFLSCSCLLFLQCSHMQSSVLVAVQCSLLQWSFIPRGAYALLSASALMRFALGNRLQYLRYDNVWQIHPGRFFHTVSTFSGV